MNFMNDKDLSKYFDCSRFSKTLDAREIPILLKLFRV